MTGRVAAQVILRRADVGAARGPVTTQQVEDHRVDESVVERAVAELRRLGIDVGPVGPTSISIECSKERFEHVFTTRLEVGTGPLATYQAADEIRVPETLAPYVEQVVLPTAPELFP